MDSITKVNIMTQADKAADEMVAILNDGFESGRISKQDLVSWIIQFFRKSSFDKLKDRIRDDHFDELAHLENVLKEMKEARKQSRQVDVSKLLAPISVRAHGKIAKESQKPDKVS